MILNSPQSNGRALVIGGALRLIRILSQPQNLSQPLTHPTIFCNCFDVFVFHVARINFRVLGINFRVNVSVFRVIGINFRVLGINFRVNVSVFRVSGINFRFPGINFRVNVSVFRVIGINFRFPGINFRVNVSVFHVPCSNFSQPIFDGYQFPQS
ncbi:hypothetical protein NIES2107_45310 [Nostoc carneum NIES-2107]|nr:hypothetical protein NIES2107_45310 [Nostoc carneum NIES-2107]